MEITDTLRDRKKAATRQSLHEAALRLALAGGLDDVTVVDIADEVGVSRRTFSNYFANKEDAVLHADRERTKTLLQLVRDRPPGERAWLAVRRAAIGMYQESPLDLEWVKQLRLLRRHPSLLARQAADQIAMERDLALVLVARGHGLEAELARLMAATFLATLRTSAVLWLEESGSSAFPDVFERMLGRVHLR